VESGFFSKLQKYHGIGQTLISKTAVSFTPKQSRVLNTRVFLQNHGMVSKLQKYFVSKQGHILNVVLQGVKGQAGRQSAKHLRATHYIVIIIQWLYLLLKKEIK
jgi:hypothetical protein